MRPRTRWFIVALMDVYAWRRSRWPRRPRFSWYRGIRMRRSRSGHKAWRRHRHGLVYRRTVIHRRRRRSLVYRWTVIHRRRRRSLGPILARRRWRRLRRAGRRCNGLKHIRAELEGLSYNLKREVAISCATRKLDTAHCSFVGMS